MRYDTIICIGLGLLAFVAVFLFIRRDPAAPAPEPPPWLDENYCAQCGGYHLKGDPHTGRTS